MNTQAKIMRLGSLSSQLRSDAEDINCSTAIARNLVDVVRDLVGEFSARDDGQRRDVDRATSAIIGLDLQLEAIERRQSELVVALRLAEQRVG